MSLLDGAGANNYLGSILGGKSNDSSASAVRMRSEETGGGKTPPVGSEPSPIAGMLSSGNVNSPN